MRKLIKWALLASFMLLIGSQVEARESSTDLGLAVGQTLIENQAYKQSTTIQQSNADDSKNKQETILSTLSYENIDNFSGTYIQKADNVNAAESILQVETQDKESKYKQNGEDWQQSLTNDSFFNKLNIFSMDQVANLLAILDATGEWTGSLSEQSVSFDGESDNLTNLLNQIVNDPFNKDATHHIKIVTDRQSKEIKSVNWTVTGTSRVDNQAIATDILVKLSYL